MRNWPWGLLSGLTAFATGCEQPIERRPAPPIDVDAPTTIETATFALG